MTQLAWLSLCGLLRKTKGRFFVTRKYQQLTGKAGFTGLYPLLFKTYCRKFNWGYRDGYEDIPFIRDSLYTTDVNCMNR